MNAPSAVAIRRTSIAAAVACAAAAIPASAAEQRFACAFAPSSSFTQTTAVQVPLAGTWIGNYDATNNPTGTRTIPGLFGGSGNNPIPFSGILKPTASIDNSHPAGDFDLTFDSATGALAISELALDALNGQEGTIQTSMVLTYATFRTVQPTSTYFGVTGFEVPLTTDQVTEASAVQTGPAVGVASPTAVGTWSFSVGVPVDFTIVGTAFATPFNQTVPSVLAMTGTITITPTGLLVQMSASGNETTPIPAGPPVTGIAIPLPTMLPPGQTANLLMDATFTEGTANTQLSMSLDAPGTPISPSADLNGDGLVNGADLGMLLSAWGTSNAAADLSGNGIVDGADLGMMLSAWN